MNEWVSNDSRSKQWIKGKTTTWASTIASRASSLSQLNSPNLQLSNGTEIVQFGPVDLEIPLLTGAVKFTWNSAWCRVGSTSKSRPFDAKLGDPRELDWRYPTVSCTQSLVQWLWRYEGEKFGCVLGMGILTWGSCMRLGK